MSEDKYSGTKKMLDSMSKGKQTKIQHTYCRECKEITEHLFIYDRGGNESWCKICGEPIFF